MSTAAETKFGGPSSAWATKILIALNAAVFCVMVASTGWNNWSSWLNPSDLSVLAFGASSGGATIVDHQYWRLVSCAFVHAGLIHLAFNMYILWDLGPDIERLFGDVKFVVIYFTAAFGGAIASIIWNPQNITAGASGAVFGLFGAMFAYVGCHHGEFSAAVLKAQGRFLAVIIVFIFYCMALNLPIDHAAHLGGMLVGALAGLCVMPPSVGARAWSNEDRVRLTSAFVLLYGVFFYNAGLPATRAAALHNKADICIEAKKHEQALACLNEALKIFPDDVSMLIERGLVESELGKFEAALSDCNMAIELKSDDPRVYIIRARVFHSDGRYADAVNDYSQALRFEPKQDPMVYNNRAWAYVAMGDYEKALQDSQTSLKSNPNSVVFYDTRGVAQLGLLRLDDARADFDRAIAIKDTDGAPYFHRAMVFRIQGDGGRAAADDLKARTLGYKPEQWENRFNDLKALPKVSPEQMKSQAKSQGEIGEQADSDGVTLDNN